MGSIGLLHQYCPFYRYPGGAVNFLMQDIEQRSGPAQVRVCDCLYRFAYLISQQELLLIFYKAPCIQPSKTMLLQQANSSSIMQDTQWIVGANGYILVHLRNPLRIPITVRHWLVMELAT